MLRPMANQSALLREHGLQVTAQRMAVLGAVAASPHATADDIAEGVRAEIGTISRQAVYDALGILAEKGLIRRIQPAGSPARYEDRVGDNHHHVICRTCGTMVDVDCAVGYTPCLTAADDSGVRDRRGRSDLLGQMPGMSRDDCGAGRRVGFTNTEFCLGLGVSKLLMKEHIHVRKR